MKCQFLTNVKHAEGEYLRAKKKGFLQTHILLLKVFIYFLIIDRKSKTLVPQESVQPIEVVNL